MSLPSTVYTAGDFIRRVVESLLRGECRGQFLCARCLVKLTKDNLDRSYAKPDVARAMEDIFSNPGALIQGPGGGKIGAVLVSPYIEPGTVVTKEYNHYSLLRTIEDLFGLDHLGYAESPNPGAFGADVFTRPQGLTPPRLRMSVRPRRLKVGEPTRLRIKVDQRARIRMRGVCGRRKRTTNRRGRLTLRHVVAHRKGKCRLRATRKGYHRATKRLRAR